jgi:hypothetical protein
MLNLTFMGNLSLQEHILTHHTHKISSMNLVFVLRCSSPPSDPVYTRRVDSSGLVFSLSSHHHSIKVLSWTLTSSIDNKHFFSLLTEVVASVKRILGTRVTTDKKTLMTELTASSKRNLFLVGGCTDTPVDLNVRGNSHGKYPCLGNGPATLLTRTPT